MWQSLLHGRDFLKTSGRWSVGSGNSIHITQDRWLANGDLARLNEGSQVTKVNEIINANHCWNLEAMRTHLHPTTAIASIQTPISWSNLMDEFLWPYTKDGTYSVNSDYRRILDVKPNPTSQVSSSSGIPKNCWNIIWGATTPEKIKHFLWKACHNAIASRDNLFRRRFAGDGLCPHLPG